MTAPNNPDTTCIRFCAGINRYSIESLFRLIDQRLAAGMKVLHLLISSPGGTVTHGMAMYNYLAGLRGTVKVITHNFGTVDSIGVVLFCAGTERKSVPHARFLLHPVGHQVQQGMRIDDHWVLEAGNSMKIDQSNIARVIAQTTNTTETDIAARIQTRTTLSPDEAVAIGLVTEIDQSLAIVGNDFFAIHESAGHPPGAVHVPAPYAQTVTGTPDSSTSVPDNSTSVPDISTIIPDTSTNLYEVELSVI